MSYVSLSNMISNENDKEGRATVNYVDNSILNTFNKGKIKHITACNMLNEGINLVNCKYGIFANINASEYIQIQRVGKL